MANSDLIKTTPVVGPSRDPLSPSRQEDALRWALNLSERHLRVAMADLAVAEKAEREDGFTGAQHSRDRFFVASQCTETLRAIVAGMRI